MKRFGKYLASENILIPNVLSSTRDLLLAIGLLTATNFAAATPDYTDRYCADFLTDRDQRFESKVLGASDVRHANKALFKLLNEAFTPLLDKFVHLVLRQTPDQVWALARSVEESYPTFGPIPFDVLRSPALLDNRRHHSAKRFFYWLLFPERHFVSADPGTLIEESPTLRAAFEIYFAQAKKKWESLNDREDHSARFLKEWDEAHSRERVRLDFAEEGELRVMDQGQEDQMLSFATPRLIAFRERLRAVEPETRSRLFRVLPEIHGNITTALAHYPFDSVTGKALDFIISLAGSSEARASHFDDDHYFLELGSPTPIGAYGEAFARTLLSTSKILNSIIVQNLKEDSLKVYENSPRLIERETGRGYYAIRGETWRERLPLTPRSTLQEGVISLAQLLALVLGERTPTFESGGLVVQSLLENDFVTGLTVRHPMGVIGPASLGGFFYHDALCIQNGKLALTPTLTEKLLKLKQAERHRFTSLDDSEAPERSRECNEPNGIGCPMAGDQGLRKLSKAFLHVFKILNAHKL